MSLRLQLIAASAVALAAVTTGCTAQKQKEAATPPPSVVSAEYKRKLAAVAQKMVAKDKADEAEKRAAMTRVIDARLLRTTDDARAFSMQLQLKNKTKKRIKAIGVGVEIHDRTGKRIGLTEIDGAAVRLGAYRAATVWLHQPYVRFGEDAGTMRLAQGKPKHAAVHVIEIKYTDGTDAGYDD